jgi:hypothetical protein
MAHTQRVRYSEMVDQKLRAELVTIDSEMAVGGVPIFNTKYEGDPKAGSVKIPVRDTEVSNRDYDKAAGIAPETGTTTFVDLLINKDKAVNEIIDGYDAESVPGSVVADRLDSAGYSQALTLDADGIATLVAGGTDELDTVASTKDTIYENILDSGVSLSNDKIPKRGRWMIIAPSYLKLLKLSPDFVKEGDLSQELLMDGAIGKVDGVVVYESSELPADVEYIMGHSAWCTRVQEWTMEPKVVSLEQSANFVGASAVKGRKVYGHKVTKAVAVRIKKFV